LGALLGRKVIASGVLKVIEADVSPDSSALMALKLSPTPLTVGIRAEESAELLTFDEVLDCLEPPKRLPILSGS